MNKELADNSKHYFIIPVLSGLCIYFVAVLCSMILVGLEPAIEIKRPWVLIIISVVGLIPVKEKSFCVLQKLLVAYFLCMLISQLTFDKMIIGRQSFRMILPKSLIPLFLYAAAFVFYILKENIREIWNKNQIWYGLWGISFILLTIHIACLWIPLKRIYGYGYIHNITILGKLLLYMICFAFTWNILDKHWIRYLSSVSVTVYLLILALF